MDQKPNKQTNEVSKQNSNESKQSDKQQHQQQQTGKTDKQAIKIETATLDKTTTNQQQKPRRPRPLRSLATTAQTTTIPAIPATTVAIDPNSGQYVAAQVGVPLRAQIELAQAVGVLPAQCGRASTTAPKRPAHLPARFHPLRAGIGPTQTSLGANVSLSPAMSGGVGGVVGGPASGIAGAAGERPNRYSWVQMQQWYVRQQQQQQQQAAAAAALAAAEHESAAQVDGTGQSGRTQGFHYHFPSTPFFNSAAERVLYINPKFVDNFQHTKSRLIKFIEALKRFSEKWFSHVLLLMFLAVYACLGAYVFISFEASQEQYEKQQINDLINRIVNESYSEAQSLGEPAFKMKMENQLREYERLMNRVCAAGISSSSLENQWTFWGALFYSMTVFTTIGYGHLTPITFAGRCATMVYAIFGIPILLMVLADLGKLLTRIIKFSFKKFNYIYNKLLGRKAPVRLRTQQLISDNTQQYFGVARDAFERGFAQYIQPYQTRFGLTSTFNQDHNNKAAAANLITGSNNEMPTSATIIELSQEERDPQLVASEVLVTPLKQTKPVSPEITTNTKKLDANARSHYHRRSQSPGVGHRQRKISNTNKPNKDKTQAAINNNNNNNTIKPSQTISRSPSAQQVASNVAAVSAMNVANSITGDSKEQQQQQKANDEDNQISKLGESEQVKADVALPVGDSQTGSDTDNLHSQSQVQPVAGVVDSVVPLENAGQNHETELQENDVVDGDQVEAEQEQGELDEEEQEELLDEDDFDIPVSFALFLLITYMMAGAFVFSIWEGWNFFDSLYFVFISMSTIGFGDLVPQHPKRMVGTFAYLLFGLALTSMCINVVQEKIHATFLRAKMQIGEKMGFDLEQIMADDYYCDPGYAGEDGDNFDDSTTNNNENDSIAVSSIANSVPPHALTDHGVTDQVTGGGSLQQASKAKSKSKESLRNTFSTSPSLQRQPSLKSMATKKSDQVHKTKQSSDNKSDTSSLQKQHQQTDSITGVKPIKAQLETIQVHSCSSPSSVAIASNNNTIHSTARTASQSPRPLIRNIQQPFINQPVELMVRGFCEAPPRQLTSSALINATAQQQQQQQQRTLPLVPSKSLDSSAATFFQTNATINRQHNRLRRPSPLMNGTVMDQPSVSSSGGGRQDGHSRRASVSHELRQLDDLISVLNSNRSSNERFGPLLGVPQTSLGSRPSRSMSPMAAQSFAGTPNDRYGTGPLGRVYASSTSPNRRGTSLVDRQRSSPLDGSHTLSHHKPAVDSQPHYHQQFKQMPVSTSASLSNASLVYLPPTGAPPTQSLHNNAPLSSSRHSFYSAKSQQNSLNGSTMTTASTEQNRRKSSSSSSRSMPPVDGIGSRSATSQWLMSSRLMAQNQQASSAANTDDNKSETRTKKATPATKYSAV